MHRLFLSSMLCSIFLGVGIDIGGRDHAAASEPFRVAGYLPDYRAGNFDPDAAKGITDLIVFSAELAEDGSLDASKLDGVRWPSLWAFKKEQQARLVLSIGGWGRSSGFPAASTSAPLRRRCVQNIVQFLESRGLDGVDLDWEHPKGGDEEEAYGLLLSDLSAALKPKGLTLSVTIAAWQGLTPLAIESADYVQVMSYDHDGKHSTLKQAKADIEKLIGDGVPAGKLVLGVPFYGRDVNNRNAMTYGEIVAKFAPEPDVDQREAMYFNGPKTISEKVKFAQASRLGGVMIWEIGQDASGEHSLMKVIGEATQVRR